VGESDLNTCHGIGPAYTMAFFCSLRAAFRPYIQEQVQAAISAGILQQGHRLKEEMTKIFIVLCRAIAG